MDTSARGSDSGGLVKGSYVRGGACVGPGAHVSREVERTTGASREDIRTTRSHAWTLSLEGRCADRPGEPRAGTLQAPVVFPSWLFDHVLCLRPRWYELCALPASLVHSFRRRFKPHTNKKNKVKLHPRPVGEEERSCWGGLVPSHLAAGTQTGRLRHLAWNPDQAGRVDALELIGGLLPREPRSVRAMQAIGCRCRGGLRGKADSFSLEGLPIWGQPHLAASPASSVSAGCFW